MSKHKKSSKFAKKNLLLLIIFAAFLLLAVVYAYFVYREKPISSESELASPLPSTLIPPQDLVPPGLPEPNVGQVKLIEIPLSNPPKPDKTIVLEADVNKPRQPIIILEEDVSRPALPSVILAPDPKATAVPAAPLSGD